MSICWIRLILGKLLFVEEILDEMNTNASATQAGFHYQNMVGLILLLDNINDIESINVEGTDDIDILFNDGYTSYYQVKEVQNPNAKNTPEKLRAALKTLLNDSKTTKVRKLVYVSNAYFPLGVSKDSKLFDSNYLLYSYNELPEGLQKKVDAQISKLNINFDTSKFYVLRIGYAGGDVRSKESELDRAVDEFIQRANLSKKIALKEHWKNMISDSTERADNKITKKDFYNHTVIIETLTNPNFDEFFEKYKIEDENEDYIKRNYNDIIDRFIYDFPVVNSIHKEFINFRVNNSNLGRDERKKQFVMSTYRKIAKKLELDNQEDFDIIKLIISTIIRTRSISNQLKETINFDNK